MINLFSSFDLTQASLLFADFNVGRFALQVLLFASSLWLIFLVLIQRGKGGGLTGALDGSGGGSAFGAKAGDAFTKVTVISATLWIFLCMVTIAATNPPPPPLADDDTAAVMGGSEGEGEGEAADAAQADADGAEAAAGDADATAEGDSSSAGSTDDTAAEGAADETDSIGDDSGDDNSFQPGGGEDTAGGSNDN